MTRSIGEIEHDLKVASERYINYDGAKSTSAATLGTVLRLRDELNAAEAEQFIGDHVVVINVKVGE